MNERVILEPRTIDMSDQRYLSEQHFASLSKTKRFYMQCANNERMKTNAQKEACDQNTGRKAEQFLR